MSYLVLARKYRPQTLGDLAGQEAIAQTLTNAMDQDRVSHALILCGPRGVGKTSTARILAKSLNCTTSPGPNPCGTCDACVSITEGHNMDVIEIDGASNNGVDHIRDLRDNVKFATASAKYKIYIIDEVHMLSKAAFNALLKTLEEPPPHVKFIFATTEIQKVPETIRSRTQRFDFKLVAPAQISAHLTYICTSEKIPFNEDALLAIAAAGRGSIRDALTLLDQAIVYANGTITTETITAMTGALSFDNTHAIATNLINSEGGTALNLVDELLTHGVAVDQIFGQLIEFFRVLMLIPENPKGMEAMFNLTTEQLESIRHIEWSQESAIYALQLLNQGRTQAGLYPEPRIALEMSLIRCARIDNIVALADIVSGKKKIERAEQVQEVTPAKAVANTTVKNTTNIPANIPVNTPANTPTNAPLNIPTHTTAEVITKSSPKENTPPVQKDLTGTDTHSSAGVLAKPSITATLSAPTKDATPNNAAQADSKFDAFIDTVNQRFPSFALLLRKAKHEIEGTKHRFIIFDADPLKMERLCARTAKIEISLCKSYGDDASISFEAYEEDESSTALASEAEKGVGAKSRNAPLQTLPQKNTTKSTPVATTPSTPVALPWDDATPKPLPSALPFAAPDINTDTKTDTNTGYTTGPSSSSLMEQANNDPGVQALKKAFNCSITNVSTSTNTDTTSNVSNDVSNDAGNDAGNDTSNVTGTTANLTETNKE